MTKNSFVAEVTFKGLNTSAEILNYDLTRITE